VSSFNLDLSRALKAIIKERGVEQHDIAVVIDRSDAHVSNRLTGKLTLTTEIIEGAADLLGLSPHALVMEMLARTHPQDSSPGRANRKTAG